MELYRLFIQIISTIFIVFISMNSNCCLVYRVILPNEYEENITIDLNKTNFIEFKQYKIPLHYSSLLNTYGESIVRESIETIALEQVVFDNRVEFVKYSVNYVMIDLNNTIYELYYDLNYSILVYGIVFDKQSNLEYEIILKTKINALYINKTLIENTRIDLDSLISTKCIDNIVIDNIHIILILILTFFSGIIVFAIVKFYRK